MTLKLTKLNGIINYGRKYGNQNWDRPRDTINLISTRWIHSFLPAMGHGRGRMNPSHGHTKDRGTEVEHLMKRLRKVSSGPLCDADKTHRQMAVASTDGNEYAGLSFMCPASMKLRNPKPRNCTNENGRNVGMSNVMVGMARTVQLSQPNDFLAVLDALYHSHAKDVLVVNTAGSTRAVAGSLFTCEAARRGLSGIVVDGPIRDVGDLPLETSVYSTMVSPYAGTVQNPGDGIDHTPVMCGGVIVHPGDVIFGDADSVLVGNAATFATILDEAENIMAVEQHMMEGMKLGIDLHSMTNYAEHIIACKEGKSSALEFKDRNTVKFTGLNPIHLS